VLAPVLAHVHARVLAYVHALVADVSTVEREKLSHPVVSVRACPENSQQLSQFA
jgi:hypothetical protein